MLQHRFICVIGGQFNEKRRIVGGFPDCRGILSPVISGGVDLRGSRVSSVPQDAMTHYSLNFEWVGGQAGQ